MAEARVVLIDLYCALVRARVASPVTVTMRTAREILGLPFADDAAAAWLRPFAKRPTAPKSSKTAVFHSFRLTITVPETTKKSDETEEAL